MILKQTKPLKPVQCPDDARESPIARPYSRDRNVPIPCFGREHGRNKGEFNSLGLPLGLILPMSLTRWGGGAKCRTDALKVFVPRTGSIAPGTAPRNLGRLFGIVPGT